MAKNIFITVLLLIIFTATAYLWGAGKLTTIWTPESTPTTQEEKIESEIETQTSPIETEKTPSVSAEDEIRQAMATKHSKPLADTSIEINEITANHAKGVVKFSGEIAGGWFLAAKTTGPWQIIADGNGTVMCSDIDPYNFPNTMVTECWDDVGNQLITR